ncbi:MAG: hypothetical protein RLZZ524_732, partial [Pseudomonadota bacterium]
PRGEQHRIEAPRGERLNVMAALLSSGQVVHAHYWETSTAETFLVRIPVIVTGDSGAT